MSMLAEPRRKQKWSVDPRNSTWSNDDSKFGQKMLERMGWSKGKGLGRTEQGSTEHIKVKVKNNNYGLGTNASHEDNWIAHQDDFNELLAQLNNCHGQNNSSESPADEQKGFSLEEKSKTSRKRVHYTKFTKGKDLSSRSETDLNCIFGKRAKSAKDLEQESNSSDSQGEAEVNATTGESELDAESITKTVTSTLTMQEYFAQRMAQLKKAREQTQNSASSVADSPDTSSPADEPCPIHSSNGDTEKAKKKRKKKKNKEAADEVEIVGESSPTVIAVEDDDNQELKHSGKRKKRKMAENKGATNENCSSTPGTEQNCEELPPTKKKKHKKHNKEAELLNGRGTTEDQAVESEVVKKKKKKRREKVDSVVEEEKQELVEKKPKKDKKKKKKHQE